MLSHHEKQSVINILDDILGVGTSMKNDEQAHYCPFCHHHKKKLQINLKTQKWHCWVCDAKGKRIQRLLKRLNVDSRKLEQNTKGYENFRNFSEMSGQDLFNQVMSKINKTEKPNNPNKPKFSKQLNTDCPIKPGRAIDPTLLALNENGETVAFCCESCVDKYKSQQDSKKQEYRKSFVKDRNSVRASELPSPAPIGHLIREFGGSDREQIENSDKSASATQVLNLINGFVETRLLKNKNFEIIKAIQSQKTLKDKIEVGYKYILNREPTSKELRIFTDNLKNKKDEHKEIIWALINTHEFMFVK